MEISKSLVTRRQLLMLLATQLGGLVPAALAKQPTLVTPQLYFAEVLRALETLQRLGGPISDTDSKQLHALANQSDALSVDKAEQILGRYTLARIDIGGLGNVSVAAGRVKRDLVEQGWRMFLLRISNARKAGGALTVSVSARSGLSGLLGPAVTPGRIALDPAQPVFSAAQRSHLFDTVNKGPLIEAMWLTSKMEGATTLSGTAIEYRVIQLFSRDRGRRSATVLATLSHDPDASFGTSSSDQDLDFTCLPSNEIRLAVTDSDGRACVASITIKDLSGRVYPPQVMRLAPDLGFQPQIYRADGETVRLPDGEYMIEGKRGPEYLAVVQKVSVDAAHGHIDVRLQRWIDPSKWGWYSGDTHIHAAGCAHYASPTEGVSPETMIRQVRGEGLWIGDVLTWGPGWYYQKQFFTGRAESPKAALEQPDLQKANNVSLQPQVTVEDSESLIRYDVEISGFPSSHAGHLVLLRLRKQDYPGTMRIEDWPSWNLPILKWAKAQGALVGYAHCGFGLAVDSTDLPNYEIPPMDSIGAQEAIIDVTHGMLDFLSGCDTNPVAELNVWYHMLNCGFRPAMVGETDYPCVSDERPGSGRSYVRLEHLPAGDARYEAWIEGLERGRLYCGDGRSHFLDFKVNGVRSGGEDVRVTSGDALTIQALVAARLEPVGPEGSLAKRQKAGWGWSVEWARIGATRTVPVELVVNGRVADSARLLADGTPRDIRFHTVVSRSSWVALRILPSAHTHPVFVRIGENPIRASKRSAAWCRACVDKVWDVKSPFIRQSERAAAAEAFDHARSVYDTLSAACGES